MESRYPAEGDVLAIDAEPEIELTRYFSQVCVDYSHARRVLADRGILHREAGVCKIGRAHV